jgi:hypothetical protein
MGTIALQIQFMAPMQWPIILCKLQKALVENKFISAQNLLPFGIWQPGSILVMLCEYRDNCLAISIYRPYGHFTYLRQSQTSSRKVFHLNFTHHLTYVTWVVYGLCCATYRIIT